MGGYKNTVSRYSYERDAYVAYRALVKQEQYCLRLYRVTHPNSSKEVEVSISVNDTLREKKVYDYSLSHDQAGWMIFGQYTFTPDDRVEVTIRKAGDLDDLVLRADALQFSSNLSRCD